MEKIGVVICNFNKVDDLDKCITSIMESIYQDIDIYVVDNASVDDSLKLLNEKYSDKVTIIANKENLGGSGGFNSGLRKALQVDYKYLMCVDNDAMLDENAIKNLKEFLDKHQECGMACAKVYHTSLPDIVQQYGITIDYEDFCVRSPYEGRLEDGTMPEYVYCDAVPACAIMVKREVVDKIGLLPEENFLYWDDTEWCEECRRAGYKIACVGNAKALHAMGAKKEVVNTFPTYYAWRNWIKFFVKYTPEEKIEEMCDTFLNSLYTIIYESLYNDEPTRIKTVMAAYDDAIHGITGKAKEGIIGPLNNSYLRENEIVDKYSVINIHTNGYEESANRIAKRLRDIAEKKGKKIDVVEDLNQEPTIKMCEFIFTVEDLSRKTIYVDTDDNILLTEEDLYFVMNYAYGRETFMKAQKDLFMRKVKELREK